MAAACSRALSPGCQQPQGGRILVEDHRSNTGIAKPMTPLEPQPATPELDRSRFQFSLRELLVATTILAILLAMLLPLLNASA